VRVNKIKEGMDMTALREIKVLKELHHPHILNLHDVFHHKRNLNLVRLCREIEATARAWVVTDSIAFEMGYNLTRGSLPVGRLAC
jgi:serine/threonine protein kinase